MCLGGGPLKIVSHALKKYFEEVSCRGESGEQMKRTLWNVKGMAASFQFVASAAEQKLCRRTDESSVSGNNKIVLKTFARWLLSLSDQTSG